MADRPQVRSTVVLGRANLELRADTRTRPEWLEIQPLDGPGTQWHPLPGAGG